MKRTVVLPAAKSQLPRPKVSILLPSRNRQSYLQQLILDLLSNPRDDIEFVIADNSDDGTIMRSFMETVDDVRVRFLPSLDHPLGMRDNFERCVENSRGEWMTMCGDDDYVDPNVADFLDHALRHRPDTDIIAWSRIYFRWPDNRKKPSKIAVSLSNLFGEVARGFLIDDYFMWRHRNMTSAVPFTVIHCLVSRKLMDEIRNKFGGRYFGHTTVDVDNFCKILVAGKRFLFSARPFSIDGSCALSNQARARGSDSFAKLQSEMVADLGFDPNSDRLIEDFPFPSSLGIAASGAQAIEYFKRKYRFAVDGWQQNYAKSCEADCQLFSLDQPDYERRVANYRAAFSAWADGRYARSFDPPVKKPTVVRTEMLGINGQSLIVDETIGNVQRPKQLYDFMQAVLAPVDQLVFVEEMSFSFQHVDELEPAPAFNTSPQRRFG
ncbi:glycosyltransferase family 2 protein [Rhizobium sp. YIM 134829]|uniref:glycosyltransferase family 2 protein n=1 Tax=Rhizobium sp. YIM 134829 TaxID=3390453 RepID=UPI003978B948